MPLICEVWIEKENRWVENHQLLPGESLSISNHSVIGGREMYVVECKDDDSRSVIYKSLSGADMEIGTLRAISSEGLLEHSKIQDGGSKEMTVLTDVSTAPRKVRFRHVKIDFGTRICLICEKEIASNVFGVHIFNHSEEEIASWPGGAIELLTFLRRSVNESRKAAKDFPRVREPLTAMMKLITQFERRAKAGRH